MGKLILTSCGYLHIVPKCNNIIENVAKKKKVLIINNATITGSNKAANQILPETFSRIADCVDIVTITPENIDMIFDYDVVYIAGGDAEPLLELAKNSNVKEKLEEFLENDGIIIGESFGSMIFGKSLRYIYDIKKGTKPKYDKELDSYNGFGFLDINIYPHWDKAKDELKQKTEEYEKEHDIVITKMCDGDYITIDVPSKQKE